MFRSKIIYFILNLIVANILILVIIVIDVPKENVLVKTEIL